MSSDLEAGGEERRAGKRRVDLTRVVDVVYRSEFCAEVLDVVVHVDEGVRKRE